MAFGERRSDGRELIEEVFREGMEPKHRRWSKANYQAARNRVRRETSSKLISVFKEFHKMQYLRIKEE